jgi:hypothetical protein
VIRLPWSRLNFSDPSSGTVLLDSREDIRSASSQDSLGTTRVDSIGVWAVRKSETSASAVYLPGRDSAWRAPLRRWDSVQVRERPKQAIEALSGLLRVWNPLELPRTHGGQL